jgi:hypothetical protein
MKLLFEAIVVAIVTGIVGFIISTIMMYIFDKKFNFKKYHFWPSVVLSFMLTGFLLHLGFEFTGANKWYCRHGNACS